METLSHWMHGPCGHIHPAASDDPKYGPHPQCCHRHPNGESAIAGENCVLCVKKADKPLDLKVFRG